jgi:hypothetical protein
MAAGTVSQTGGSYIISARLIDIETGEVLTTRSTAVGTDLLERESKAFYTSTFQSEYGISITPQADSVFGLDGEYNLFVAGVNLGYKPFRFLQISAGILYAGTNYINASDNDDRRSVFTVDSVDYTISRDIFFSGFGVKLGLDAVLSPNPRLNISAGAGAVIYLTPVLTQRMFDFPVWQSVDATSNQIETKTVIITGTPQRPYASYHVTLSGEFLVSKRISIGLGATYAVFPPFIPVYFESAGRAQRISIDEEEDIDTNGTFTEYADYNFSRIDGERLQFNFHGLGVKLMFALHF